MEYNKDFILNKKQSQSADIRTLRLFYYFSKTMEIFFVMLYNANIYTERMFFMKKKLLLISVILAAIVAASVFLLNRNTSTIRGNVVLVLDTSKPIMIPQNETLAYSADSKIEYVKGATKKYIETLLNGKERYDVAVVEYNVAANVVCGFTKDKKLLSSSIDKLKAHTEYGTDLSGGLECAEELLKTVPGEKHIVLFTTGNASMGEYLSDGRYSHDTVGGSLVSSPEGIEVYKYANKAHEIADKIKIDARIYTVGMLQVIVGAPQNINDLAEFSRTNARDLATSPDYFYAVEDVTELDDIFKTVAEDIRLNPSIWAKGEIKEAQSYGLIPSELQGQDLSKPVTRSEFVAISLELYEALVGKEVEEMPRSPFTDISSNEFCDSIDKAYALDIVIGVSPKKFSPDAYITREDLATMLCRTIKKFKFEEWTLETDGEYYLDISGVEPYDDDYLISGYAKPSVYFMSKMGIIKGVTDTLFAPKNTTEEQEAKNYATATREQAIALSLRIFKLADEIAKSELLTKAAVTEATTAVTTAEPVNADGWRDAYAEVIRNSEYYSQEWSGFELIYIDDDDIPELGIACDDSHASGVELYTYIDGKAMPINEDGGNNIYGEFGHCSYAERGSMIMVDYSGQGDNGHVYFEMNGAKAVCIKHFAEDASDSPIIYYVGGMGEVDEETFYAELEKITPDNTKTCAPCGCIPLTEDGIQQGLYSK